MGEQTKILLALLFSKENHFLLIDEPTNHLDLEGRYIVSEYLNAKKGFILVSHDHNFLDGCVNHILSINNATVTVGKGNYSTWLENKTRSDGFYCPPKNTSVFRRGMNWGKFHSFSCV